MAEVLTASFGLQAAPKWEKLRGKTYPDTESEQFAALETDETVRDYKKRREAWASDPTVLSITCPLSTVWEMRTGFANGKAGIICSINSVRLKSIGCTGDTVIARIWCTGTISLRRCIQIPNYTVLAGSASWKMNG